MAVIDISTIVSAYPFVINSSIPGLYPGYIYLPAGDPTAAKLVDKITLTHVERAVSHVYVLDGKSFKAPILSEEVAKSFVSDYLNSLMFTNDECRPAIVAFPGKLEKEDIIADKGVQLQILQALKRQEKYFVEIVKEADNAWKQTQHHRAISDQQRYAATYLKLDRPWNFEGKLESYKLCPACSTSNPPTNVVCLKCSFVFDAEKFKTMQFATR